MIMEHFNFNFLIIQNPLICLFQVCVFQIYPLGNILYFYSVEIFPPSKPISNGKPKIFLNQPDDTSSEEDEPEKSTSTEE